jgi:hypothetical protein
MNADAIIEIRFKTTAEGGRQDAIVGTFYGCPLFIDGEAFDCRLSLNGKTLLLGETYKLPVKFLNRDLVLPKLSQGKTVILWEGKEVATGRVLSFENENKKLVS